MEDKRSNEDETNRGKEDDRSHDSNRLEHELQLFEETKEEPSANKRNYSPKHIENCKAPQLPEEENDRPQQTQQKSNCKAGKKSHTASSSLTALKT